jgi:hypothetical protein
MTCKYLEQKWFEKKKKKIMVLSRFTFWEKIPCFKTSCHLGLLLLKNRERRYFIWNIAIYLWIGKNAF